MNSFPKSGLVPKFPRASGPRPAKKAPAKKPMSDQQKKTICKEELEKHQTLFFPALQEKGELSVEDVRNHLPSGTLNKLYYKMAKNLATGHGRAIFSSRGLGSGTVTFKIKLQLSPEDALKMSSGVVNRAQRSAAGSTHVTLLGKLIAKGEKSSADLTLDDEEL